MKSIKNIVLSEPLVESFESRSMIANSSLIFKFDLLRGTVNVTFFDFSFCYLDSLAFLTFCCCFRVFVL